MRAGPAQVVDRRVGAAEVARLEEREREPPDDLRSGEPASEVRLEPAQDLLGRSEQKVPHARAPALRDGAGHEIRSSDPRGRAIAEAPLEPRDRPAVGKRQCRTGERSTDLVFLPGDDEQVHVAETDVAPISGEGAVDEPSRSRGALSDDDRGPEVV